LLDKGLDRVSKQLDIVTFLRKQMMLDVLIKHQFSPLERYLARRQYKQFVLNSSASESNESEASSDSVEKGDSVE